MIQLLKVSDFMKRFFLVSCIVVFVADVLGQPTTASAHDVADESNVQRTTTKVARSLSSPCNKPRIDFESYITIDYSFVCAALTSSDIALLQNGIMTAYNDLVQPQYCDPFARLISKVTYVNETSSGDGNTVGVTFLVEGTCQGCDSMLSVNLFGTNNSDDGSISDSCSLCLDDINANRSVHEDEFLTIYASTVLNEDSQDLVCVTTIAGGAVPTRLPSQSPTQVQSNCPVDLSTRLTSQVLVTLNENATQLTLEELGQDLMDTYNTLINEKYSTCQTSKYREITNITVAPTSSATTSGGGGTIRGRQLQGLALSQETIVYDVEGGCGDGCDPDELFFDPDVLRQVDYMEFYSSVVDFGLEFFSEIKILDCPSTKSNFEDLVIVEYVPLDNSTDLSSNTVVMQELADLFVQTYNDLSRAYCDPYSRQLISANLALVGPINSFGNIPIEMEVVGTCSNCDGVDLTIYDVPTSLLLPPDNSTGNDTDLIFFEGLLARRSLLEGLFSPYSSSGRVLQLQGSGVDSTCYCPAHPVGVRGVYETEFLDAYRTVINETSPVIEEKALLTVDQGLGVEVAACQFGKEFRTGFLFDTNATSLTEEERQLTLDSFLQAITEPFLITDEMCNPEFRTFDTAEIGPNRSVNRRRAQQVTSAPSATPSLSPAPTSSPLPSFAPIPTESPTLPQISVPTLTSNIIPFYIYVSGVCNGCDDQITFEDQTVDGRRLQGHDLESTVTMSATTDYNDWVRQLQSDQSNATSNCFCPIGSEIVSNPSLQDLLDLFVANLRSVGIPYNISNFREVPVVDCTVPETQFTSQFHYLIALEHNATPTQVQAVGDIIRHTYNELIQDFCDPLDHTIDSIELVEFVPTSGESGQSRCQEYDVTFHLTGRCRECSGADTLLSSTNTSIFGRRSLHQDLFLYPFRFQSFSDDADGFANTGKHKSSSIHSSSNKPSRRRLQASLGDDCFCDGTVVDTRAPNIDEFNMALVTALSDFQVTNVCGIPNFIPTPQPTSTPSHQPSLSPTDVPTEAPTTEAPTMVPTPSPTDTTTTPAPHGKGPSKGTPTPTSSFVPIAPP